MHLKQVFILFFFLSPVLLFAQQPDSMGVKKDSGITSVSLTHQKRDSAFIKAPDSLVVKPDSSVRELKKNSAVNRQAVYFASIQNVLKENRFLNTAGKSVAMANKIRKDYSGDNFFYILSAIALLLGFFRFFYTGYFNNLFRVFFNASLRQSQLTDQLLQAKLPSLFFNVLFTFAGGVYVYLLLRYYNWISPVNFWQVLFYCTLSLGFIYLVKFITLKFTGWLTGYNEVTNTYVFIIFLINKILGILLIPFSVIIAFSVPALATTAVIISLLLIGLMFLLRFFRSYGLLQHQLKISRFHFFMYVAGIEVLPVLLIYKALVLLLSKNL